MSDSIGDNMVEREERCASETVKECTKINHNQILGNSNGTKFQTEVPSTHILIHKSHYQHIYLDLQK